MVLVTSNTRDEAFYWVSKKREATMKRIVEGMRQGSRAKEMKGSALFASGAKESGKIEQIAASIASGETQQEAPKKEDAIAESVQAKPYFSKAKGKRKRRERGESGNEGQKSLGEFF